MCCDDGGQVANAVDVDALPPITADTRSPSYSDDVGSEPSCLLEGRSAKRTRQRHEQAGLVRLVNAIRNPLLVEPVEQARPVLDRRIDQQRRRFRAVRRTTCPVQHFVDRGSRCAIMVCVGDRHGLRRLRRLEAPGQPHAPISRSLRQSDLDVLQRGRKHGDVDIVDQFTQCGAERSASCDAPACGAYTT